MSQERISIEIFLSSCNGGQQTVDNDASSSTGVRQRCTMKIFSRCLIVGKGRIVKVIPPMIKSSITWEVIKI